MAPVIVSDYKTARLPYGSNMESLHVATLHLPGLSKKARQIHINPKIITAPLISLGVLCDDGYTIPLDQQETTAPKGGKIIIRDTSNKKTGMWEVSLETQKLKLL